MFLKRFYWWEWKRTEASGPEVQRFSSTNSEALRCNSRFMNTTVTVELVDTILGCTFLQNDLSATSLLGAKLPCLRVTTNKQTIKEKKMYNISSRGKNKINSWVVVVLFFLTLSLKYKIKILIVLI